MIFFNPASVLTAGRIPYAAGGGRLSDVGTLTYATGILRNAKDTFNGGIVADSETAGGYSSIAIHNNGVMKWSFYNGPGTSHSLNLENAAGADVVRVHQSGAFSFGGGSDGLNGRVQAVAHTTPAGGFGFYDFSLYRNGAGLLRSDATTINFALANLTALNLNCGVMTATQLIASGAGAHCDVGGEFRQAGTTVVGNRRTGWSVPTGTISRAVFDESSVTLAQLAQRVAALIQDLHSTSSGHGLIGP